MPKNHKTIQALSQAFELVPSALTRSGRSARAGLGLLALLALVACGKAPDSPGPPKGGPGAGGPPPAMPVTVLKMAPQKVASALEAVGQLEGKREVEVRARVAGVLGKQSFREGEAVKAGAVLYQIERQVYDSAVDAARAAVAQADARLEQTQREGTRLSSLVVAKAISQREADDAGSNVKTALAQQALARAQLRDAQLNLSYTQVTAPISGVVQRALRSEGSLVSPTSDAGLLTTIVQTEPMRVRFALSQSEAASLRGGSGSGQQVRLLGADGTPLPTLARLDYAGSVVDPRLGMVQMRAEMPNPGGALLPGQFVRVQVTTGEQQAYLVPQAAVASGDQGRFVWLLGADGKAAPRPVQTGAWVGKDWVIKGGLAQGDLVIVDNLMKLRPGAAVVDQASMPPPGAGAGPGAGAAAMPGAASAAAKPAAPAASGK